MSQAHNLMGAVMKGIVADPTVVIGEIGRHLTEAQALVDEARRAQELEGPGDEPQPETPDEPERGPAPEPAEPSVQKEVTTGGGDAVLPEDTDMELLKEYVVESTDHIVAAEAALLDLESDPEAKEPIDTVFRAFHTIKGTSGFLGLDAIQSLAHRAETLLDRAREGEICLTGGYADLALESCDLLKAMIEDLQEKQPGSRLPTPEKFSDLLARLDDPEGAGADVGPSDTGDVPRVGDLLVAAGEVSREQIEEAAKRQGDEPLGKTLIKENVVSGKQVAQAIRTQKKMRGAADASIRVNTGRLDNLVNMVGELVIAQSMIAQDPEVTGSRSHDLVRKVSRSGKIIRELQDLAMSLRMVPLKPTFQKMTRLVRDLGRKSGKNLRFLTEGEDTEIDRNMVEVLNDPLVHMIRNACDHGIESPEDRRAAGKPETGVVRIRAYHSAGSVVIELCDDGRGLDRERILRKAVERNLIDANADLEDNEIFMLIFKPGFSTAERVTDISGRGVGMDVVKRNIESIRGRVEVTSTPGKGSKFIIRVPLTMAITDAMLLRVGSERYLLPTVAITQSFRAEPGAVCTVAGRGEVVKLRGNLIPVVRAHRLFEVPDAVTDACKGIFVALEAENKRYALMVDELLGQQQVVIKSLGRSMENIPGIAGGAILGDGRVGIILDPLGLLTLAQAGERRAAVKERSRPVTEAVPEEIADAAAPVAVGAAF